MPKNEKLTSELIKIGIALSSIRDLERLLLMIINEAEEFLSADTGTLYLIDKEKQELYFYLTDKEKLKQIRLSISKSSLAGYVALTGEILNLKDAYKIEPSLPYQFYKEIDKQTGYRTKSMLVVPLINHQKEIIGVIQLINKKVKNKILSFNKKDLAILESLASQAAVCIENTQLYQEIEELFASFIRYSAAAIDARDPVTAGHSKRVVMYSVEIARALSCFSKEQLKELEYAAWLHDIGKIGVRENILSKQNKLFDPQLEIIINRFKFIKKSLEENYLKELMQYLQNNGKENLENFQKEKENVLEEEKKQLDQEMEFIINKNKPGFMSDEDLTFLRNIYQKKFIDEDKQEKNYLTDEEYEALSVRKGNLTAAERENIESHAKYTWEILKQIPFTKMLKDVPKYATHHHEKLDGSGYPFGIKAEEISLQARIIALADIYDALRAYDRPYKPPLPLDVALRILGEEVKSNHLDGEVLKAFIDNKIYESKES